MASTVMEARSTASCSGPSLSLAQSRARTVSMTATARSARAGARSSRTSRVPPRSGQIASATSTTPRMTSCSLTVPLLRIFHRAHSTSSALTVGTKSSGRGSRRRGSPAARVDIAGQSADFRGCKAAIVAVSHVPAAPQFDQVKVTCSTMTRVRSLFWNSPAGRPAQLSAAPSMPVRTGLILPTTNIQ